MPTAQTLHDLVVALFGDRSTNKQAPTAAIGVINHQLGVYVAIQGGVFNGHAALVQEWNARCEYRIRAEHTIDARYLLVTNRKISEWTGYHAEMMIVGAMICANVWGSLDWAGVQTQIGQRGGGTICANAPACWHCGNAMDSLGIAYHGNKGDRGLTGWWNPVTDNRVAHNGSGWLHQIPGL